MDRFIHRRRIGGVGSWLAGAMVALSVLGAGPAMLAATPAWAQTTDAKPKEGQDILIFRNGNVLTGTIVSEDDRTIRFRSSVSGIAFETDYGRDQILEVKRGAKADPAKRPSAEEAPGKAEAVPPAPAPESVDDGMERVRYYWLKLDGEFGSDISETPIRQAMRDARDKKADVVIVELDARWASAFDARRELKEDDAAFDKLFRAERMTPIFVEEIPSEWDKPPRVVFWVRRAMGGAAFLPLICREIYFHPEGKIGGIGNLSTMMQGHERVVAKQVSLRLQHAVGWANVGGYPEELIRAMTREEYVLSVKLVDGKPVYVERLPEGPDEELLTDDGEQDNEDTIQQLARDEGNDTLTLDARKAMLVQVSKGTVETREELLAALGLDRSGVAVSDRADRIMEDWRKGYENAQRQIVRYLDDFRNVQVQEPGDYNARSKARGAQISKLEQIKGLLKRWDESLTPEWRQKNQVPSLDEIQSIIERIRTEQLGDKR